MSHFKRRDFLKMAGGVCTLAGSPLILHAAKTKARVVVIGGGYGGAIAAKYIRMADPGIEVTLIEKDKKYVSCPLSNEVISGDREIKTITFGYQGLSGHGVQVIHDWVTAIDPVKKVISTQAGKKITYDKAVVSPGVSFRWDAIQGYNEKVSHSIPHAWKAGEQTLILKKQLRAMKNGGVVYISAPPNPFRCPPGPYERAAQIAHYFKQHKPKSKVIILDAKDKFSKQGLFTQGWKDNYGDMIEWVGGAAGGIVEAVDPKTKVLTGTVEEFRGDVVNIIPPQQAGKIAHSAGLVNDKGWCPVDQRTFESSLHKDLYVIGDACVAGKMPKSGYAANSQGKVCAANIVAAVNGDPSPEPSYVNTCYSIIAPDYGISVAAVYQLNEAGQIVAVEGAGGLSPGSASPRTRELEADFARGWIKNIMADAFS
jgi:sulfide dehydrogenase [flavocytochrome c] flavoprotein subunit